MGGVGGEWVDDVGMSYLVGVVVGCWGWEWGIGDGCWCFDDDDVGVDDDVFVVVDEIDVRIKTMIIYPLGWVNEKGNRCMCVG